MSIKKMIVEELKNGGLEVAEDSAVKAVKVLFKLLPKIVMATPTPYDNLLIPLLPVIEPAVLELLDQIDGKED